MGGGGSSHKNKVQPGQQGVPVVGKGQIPASGSSTAATSATATPEATDARQATAMVVEDIHQDDDVPRQGQGGGHRGSPAHATAGTAAGTPPHTSPHGGGSHSSTPGKGAGGPATPGSAGTCACPGCSNPASGTSIYCSLDCRDKALELQKAPPPPIDPKTDAVVFRDPRSQFDSVGVIGFYYPDKEEECDKICCAGFLGNFWETPEKIRLVAHEPNMPDREHEFRNAEAAFQALKFWVIAGDFEDLTGDEAFMLKRRNQGFEDFTYGGKGDNWRGMRAVLDAKFAPKSAMAEALKKTDDAFLLEHNSVRGRDDVWSDNSDGEGTNWLGMQLMLIRDKITQRKEWTGFIGGLVNLESGAPLDLLKARKWQDAVRGARNALVQKVEELRPKPLCARPGCGKLAYNGQPGEYCSKYCKATDIGAICLTPNCGKPTWNFQPGGYCSKFCKQSGQGAQPDNPAPAAPCANPGCGKPSWNGAPGEFCSKTCREAAGGGTGGGIAHDTRAFSSGRSRCTLLQPGTQKYDSLKNQYEGKWDTSRCPPTPIKAIYEVNQRSDIFNNFHGSCNRIGNVKCFGHGTNPGNVQRRFHGTRMTCRQGDTWQACHDRRCSACRIVEEGFDLGKLGAWSGNKGQYGGGLYFTSRSSTAKGYGIDKGAGFSFDNGNWMDPRAGNAVLIVNIACGRVENVKGACTHQLDTSQFDSRKVDKSSGADELVIFDSAQTLVRAVIVF
uniref:NADAR domain-containing protein n=1 Tax=Pyrodinium bahamense TaxID=73915 RepID=A0A7S0AJ34_9DINO